MFNELKYRGKKNLESCYKTQFFFHIQTIKQRQRHRIKYIYDTKNNNIYFSLLGGFLSGSFCQGAYVQGAFVLDPLYLIIQHLSYSLPFASSGTL
jgi:hypothetical protein